MVKRRNYEHKHFRTCKRCQKNFISGCKHAKYCQACTKPSRRGQPEMK